MADAEKGIIALKKLDISREDDYDILLKKVEPLYIEKTVTEELKSRIGLKCKIILIEFPYRDKDFSSTYSGYHTKKHKSITKECYRLHFFSDKNVSKDSYKGFLVLRPSYVSRHRGRACISPELLTDSRTYCMLAEYPVHIFGEEYVARSYPWMSQETDIAVCAHVAVWSISRYLSEKFHFYREYTMYDITEMVPISLRRKVPSEGLYIHQIAETILNIGAHPFLLQKKADQSKFIGNVFSYVESGIPIIGAMTRKEHAVAIIGHGEINYALLNNLKGDYIYSYELIDSLVVCDDNHLPYTEIKKTANNGYTFDDLDYAIVPLYEKMFLDAEIVRGRAENMLKSKVIDLPAPLVLRVYMTSSKSLKEKVRNDRSMESNLTKRILCTPMPKFVWCVDISTKNDFMLSKMSGKIIIDITAGTYELNPWILYHDLSKVVYYNTATDRFMKETLPIKPYNIYKNNLREV
ncbi:MAG: hypothetical protein HQL61_13880 [Magnetococcales bacterium]|nr:hypothetical protein [Nitrospirota bacterium]